MSQDKKEQILSAASECFAKFGYKKTTLDDIGQEIGLNKASIYYYFESKEKIYTTIILNEFQQFTTKLRQEIEEETDCEEKILLYFKQKIQYYQKSTIIQQITEIEPEELQHLIVSGREIALKLEQEEKSFLTKILKGCIENGKIKDCNIEKMSELMFGLVDGVKHNHLGFADNKSPASIEFENLIQDVQTALKIFINGLK